jgi:hypothetical protein
MLRVRITVQNVGYVIWVRRIVWRYTMREDRVMAWGYGTIRITDYDGGNEQVIRDAVADICRLVAEHAGYDVEIELVGVER